MKLGIFGDLHFTSRGPSRRKDNFFETQMRKFREAFSIFKEEKCDYIIQPGDFFDTHTSSNKIKAEIIRFLRKELWYEEGVFFVSGQHDISGHSLHTLKNSPLAVLKASGVGTLLLSDPHPIYSITDETKVNLYGASYGEPIPNPEQEDEYNILVIHKMIGDRDLFPGQELQKPNQFLRNNPKYNLVICGDYHYRFSSEYQGRTIINAGCLVRKTISKWDLEHRPSVATFDTETGKVEFFELTCDPIEGVFDLCRDQKIDKINSQKLIDALKSRIGSRKNGGKTGFDILLEVIKEKEASEDVRNEIDDVLEEIQGIEK